MHDFAACMLGALEAWMLNASPAMASLSTLVDTPEFTGMATAPYAAEDDGGRIKRKYARLQKAMGDYSLLAGSPLDAVDHYNTAVELGRAALDWTAAASAMEGYAAAKLLHAAVSNDAFVTNATSVFHDDKAWRSPKSHRSSVEESGGSGTPFGKGVGGSSSVRGSENGTEDSPQAISSTSTGAGEDITSPRKSPAAGVDTKDTAASSFGGGILGNDDSTPGEVKSQGQQLEEEKPNEGGGKEGDGTGDGINNTPQAPEESGIADKVDEVVDEISGLDDVFTGKQFWNALRRTDGLEEEVRALYEEAKTAIRKRGGLPLLVEADLRWARLLAGLHVRSVYF